LVVNPLRAQIASRRATEISLRKTIDALTESAAEVRLLRGLLSICASCKRIRDSDGDWIQIEGYIEANSEARFTHGCCPDCARTLYPYPQTHQNGQKAVGGDK
jgi:hypothetical protein